MLKKVLNTIQKYQMIQSFDKVIVGLSGGPDSVVLLWALNGLKEQLNFELTALHVHHGLRGVAADADESFAKALCTQLEIPLKIVHRNINEEALALKISEEEAGRLARYEIFEKESTALGGAKIAVGHHKNDQAETILFNLMRGTGLKGLGGIRPVRDLIIRPLIDCTRKEIEGLCEAMNLCFQEDASNHSLIYSRNKIRCDMIPYIEQNFNPSFVNQMGAMAELLQEEDQYLDQLADAFLDQYEFKQEDKLTLHIHNLQKIDRVIRKRVYRKVIFKINAALKDYENKHINSIEDLLNKDTGKKIDLPCGVFVEKVYDTLCFGTFKKSPDRWNYTFGKDVEEIQVKEIKGRFEFKVIEQQNYANFPQNDYTKWFDYDKIKGNLTLRNRRDGDFIYLNGIIGKKKIKDYFMDIKLPRSERDQIPLLTDELNLIWIIGFRISEVYKVTENTIKILEVRYIKEED